MRPGIDEVEDRKLHEAGEVLQNASLGASRMREEARASSERVKQLSQDAAAGARRAERMQRTARQARENLEALQALEEANRSAHTKQIRGTKKEGTEVKTVTKV